MLKIIVCVCGIIVIVIPCNQYQIRSYVYAREFQGKYVAGYSLLSPLFQHPCFFHLKYLVDTYFLCMGHPNLDYYHTTAALEVYKCVLMIS